MKQRQHSQKLILGGEVHNSTASSIAYMEEKVWDKIDKVAINTLLIPIYWELIEPQPNQFDFSLIDSHLENAAEKKIDVIFLWFGLWKNGLSTYVPEWIKTDPKYFRIEDSAGNKMNSYSPLCQDVIAQAHSAFAAICDYLGSHPLRAFIRMVQIENEIGSLGTSRDHSSAAEKVYQMALPQEIRNLYPGAKQWSEVPFGDEVFMAYHYAAAIQDYAKIARKRLALPLYTNVWLKKPDRRPREYPSGGAVSTTWQVWKVIASQLDFIAPDIYEEEIKPIIAEYGNDQPLLIPETRIDKRYISNLFYAFGQGAIGYSPFGIEDLLTDDTSQDYRFLSQLGLAKDAFDSSDTLPHLNQGYRIIAALEPLLQDQEAQIFSFKKEGAQNQIVYENGQDRWAVKLFSRDRMINSAGLIIKHKEYYYLTGANFALDLQAQQGSNPLGILSLEEGGLQDGQWRTNRRLNGDEAYFPFIGEDFKILRMRLYSY